MPEALIRCPACNHELRLPTELAGRTVECPQCGNRFTSPAALAPAVVRPVDEQGPTYAEDQRALVYNAGNSLRAPAVILLVLSMINLLFSGWIILGARAAVSDPDAFEVQMHQEIDRQANARAEDRDRFKKILTAEAVRSHSTEILTAPGIMAAAALMTVLGCVQMLRVRAYWLCIIGSVLALNPVNCCPTCVMEAPFGIWALIVLLNADVRRAFT